MQQIDTAAKNFSWLYLAAMEVIKMRIDKYLKVSRLIKRRTVAAEACSAGKIFVNGKEAKPGAEVKIGDIIEINMGARIIKAEILALNESTKKEDASLMYKIVN